MLTSLMLVAALSFAPKVELDPDELDSVVDYLMTLR